MKKTNALIRLSYLFLGLSVFFPYTGKASPGAPPLLNALSLQKRFSFKVMKEMAKDESHGNLMISPVGLYALFSMFYEGSSSKLEKFLDNILQLDEKTKKDFEKIVPSLIQVAKEIPGVKLANGVWFFRKNPPKENYTRRLSTYGAFIGQFTGNGEEDAKLVNQWGKLFSDEDYIVDPVQWKDKTMNIFFVNMFKFAADWLTSFSSSSLAMFQTTSGRNISVPFLSGHFESIPYLKKGEYQAIRLPYKSSGSKSNVSVLLVLPPSTQTPSGELIDKTDEFLSLKEWSAEKVIVSLPAVNISVPSHHIIQALNSMGKNDILGSSGTNINEGIHQMSDVRIESGKQPKISVAMFGSLRFSKVGALATSVSKEDISIDIIGSSSDGNVKGVPISIDFNRPFMAAIIDDKSNSILVLALIKNP